MYAPTDILNESQVADIFKVTKATVKRYFSTGKIPAQKIGKEWRISYQHLLDYINGKLQNETAVQATLKQELKKCPSTKEMKSGTSTLPHQTASAYANLLTLPINGKRKSTTTH